MFEAEIKALQTQYSDRFKLVQTLSKAKGGLGGLFKKDKEYGKGRIEAGTVKTFVNGHPSANGASEYYICGPGSMIDNTKTALQNLNIPNEQIFIESFGVADSSSSATEPSAAKGSAVDGAQLVVHLNGDRSEIVGQV